MEMMTFLEPIYCTGNLPVTVSLLEAMGVITLW